MRGVQKSKRVSWATDGNLRQVRLFLSDDSPSLAGADFQDHLQAKKTTSFLHGTGSGPDGFLPPGFEGVNTESQLLKNKQVRIPLIKWRSPPKFGLDAAWRVVAGEGSKEVETQNVRELRVLEAIYPRSSTIPPDPQVSLDIKNSVYDDRTTPFVPITPIEEEEGISDFSNGTSLPAEAPSMSDFSQSSCAASSSTPNVYENEGLATSSNQPYLLAAATAALSAVAANNNQTGKMIDHELLIKILSNPTVLENLAKNHGNNSSSNNSMLSTAAVQCSSKTTTIRDPPLDGLSQIDSNSASSMSKDKLFPSRSPNINPSQPVQYPRAPTQPASPTPPATGVGMASFSTKSVNAPPPPPAKDLNYYKSLIQQHGGDKHPEFGPASAPHCFPGYLHNGTNQHNLHPPEFSRNRELKPKFSKPCLYVNSAKGCRNGANCMFQHDGPMFQAQQQRSAGSNGEMPGAKRFKTDNRDTRGPPQPYI